MVAGYCRPAESCLLGGGGGSGGDASTKIATYKKWKLKTRADWKSAESSPYHTAASTKYDDSVDDDKVIIINESRL